MLLQNRKLRFDRMCALLVERRQDRPDERVCRMRQTRRVMFAATLLGFGLSSSSPCFAQGVSAPAVTWKNSSSTGLAIVGGGSMSTLTQPSGPFAQEPEFNTGWLTGVSVRLRDGRVAGGTAEVLTGERRMTELLAGTHRPLVFRSNFIEAPAMARIRVLNLGLSIEAIGGVSLGWRFRVSSELSTSTARYKGGAYVHGLAGLNLVIKRILFGVRYERGLSAFSPAKTSLGKKYLQSFCVSAGYRIR